MNVSVRRADPANSDRTGRHAAHPPQGRDRRWLVLLLMCVGMFLVQLDVTVVNVALPAMRNSLGTSMAGLQWIVDGYAVALATLLLAGGTAGDRYGHKRVVLAGMGVFAAASLACGLASTVGMLVAARVGQGIGAALLLPGTLAVITRTFPERGQQARALGIWAGVSALALPAGPLIGGALVAGLGWQAVFLINLPILAVAAPATARVVRTGTDTAPAPLDLPGTALAALTLGGLVYLVIAAGSTGLGPRVWASAAVAVLGAAGFVAVEHRSTHPVLPPRLLRRPGFVGPNLVAAAMNFVGIGTVFIATLWLQGVQHHPVFTAGLLLLPAFVPLAALAPVTGRLTARYGPRPCITAGLLLGAAGSAALIGLEPTSSYLRFLPVLLALGCGMGLLTAAVVSAAVAALPPERAGLASGVNNTARQAAGALGIAVYGAVAGSPTDPEAFAANLGTVGVIAATLWVAALPLTWRTVAPRG